VPAGALVPGAGIGATFARERRALGKPWRLMLGRSAAKTWCVAAAFVLPAILYSVSLVPDVGSWDVGEMQTVLYILGIGHTTGYPAFVLAGWLFSHGFALGTIAWRINLLGALYFAGASCTISAIQMRLGVRPIIAMLASLLFASGTIVWNHAIRIDVLSMAALFAALTLWLLLRWSQERDGRSFVAACVVIALSLGDHLVIVWTLPSIVIFVWLNRAALRRSNVLGGVLAGFVTLICEYAYIPIRSAVVTAGAYDRTLSLGFPSGHPYWDYGHPADLHNFIGLITGAQVNATSSFGRMLSLPLLFSGLSHFCAIAFAEFSIVGAIALAVGIVVGWRRFRDVTLYTFVASVLIALFTAAFSAETDPDRYYIVSFVLLTPFVGIGASAAADALITGLRLRERSGNSDRNDAGRRDHVGGDVGRGALARVGLSFVTAVLVTTIAIGVYRERAVFGWHYDRWGGDYVARVRALTPNNAVIVAPWVLASPLAYAEYVERSYGDRIVAAGSVAADGIYLVPVLRSRPVYIVLDAHVPKGFRLRKVSGADPPIYKLDRSR
jgi:hypothetical protein